MNNTKEVECRGLEVQITSSFEEGMKRFKSMVQKEKILSLYKERMRYEKPSVKKRRKHREALERQMETEHRERLMITGEWDKIQKKKEKKRQEKLANKKSQNNAAQQ